MRNFGEIAQKQPSIRFRHDKVAYCAPFSGSRSVTHCYLFLPFPTDYLARFYRLRRSFAPKPPPKSKEPLHALRRLPFCLAPALRCIISRRGAVCMLLCCMMSPTCVSGPLCTWPLALEKHCAQKEPRRGIEPNTLELQVEAFTNRVKIAMSNAYRLAYPKKTIKALLRSVFTSSCSVFKSRVFRF